MPHCRPPTSFAPLCPKHRRPAICWIATGSPFANVGGGSLVDETALLAALESGRLGGAILDVTRREPLPPDDPLWTAPRTILTQHTCAGSDRVARDTLNFFGANLARYQA